MKAKKDRKKFYYFTVRVPLEDFEAANEARKSMGLPWPYIIKQAFVRLAHEAHNVSPEAPKPAKRGRPAGSGRKA